MNGKVALVTGANQGIGKATATGLARQGARVVIVSRNEEKGRAAVEDVQRAAENRDVELIVADLSSLDQVRRVASEFESRHDRLDVLVNNAGVLVPDRRVTVDGIEETFAINHLAYFVLTRALLDVMKRTGRARIVNVSSEAHRHAKMHWDDLGFERGGYRSWRAYGQSKLANVLFTYELARRLEGTGVTANALHPGVIGSGFGQTYGGVTAFFIKLAKPFLLTPEEGARTSVYVASSPDVEGVSGKYFARQRAARTSALSYDEASQRKLWLASEQMISGSHAVAPAPQTVSVARQ